jgi:hypothetical protein
MRDCGGILPTQLKDYLTFNNKHCMFSFSTVLLLLCSYLRSNLEIRDNL